MEWNLTITIYAAIVATAALVWNIIEAKKRIIGNFLVKFGFDIKESREKEMDILFFEKMKIRAVNIKSVPRKVRIYSIQYFPKDLLSKFSLKRPKDFKSSAIIKTFSSELENSEEHVFDLDENSLAFLRPEYISKLRIVLIDNTGKKYFSKYRNIDEDTFELSSSTIQADL